jgi:alcohol dehydrogenase class IV
MATKINRKEEIIARLSAEGKVKIMDSPEDHATRERINDYFEEVRREYILISRGSEMDAAKIILTS